MTAYSYKRRFVDPIQVGLGLPALNSFGVTPPTIRPKRQTIRADRKRHARPGEEIQHYCGMRTKSCFLIGRGICTDVRDIVLTFGKLTGVSIGNSEQRQTHYQGNGLDHFAQLDGFENWRELVMFWEYNHGTLTVFTGKLIEWKPL